MQRLLIFALALFAAACSIVSPGRSTGRNAMIVPEESAERYAIGDKAEARAYIAPWNSETEGAYLGTLYLAAGASVPEHRDPTDEFIYILSGHGKLFVDDKEYLVAPGTAFFMPAHSKVSFQVTGGEPVQAVQVFAPPGPERKYLNAPWQKK